jgi:transposase-like protein
MDRPTAVLENPPSCPMCPHSEGNAVSVRISPSLKITTYRCPQCQREWTVEAPDTEGGLFAVRPALESVWH